jgi:hypothetical protein
MVRYLTKNASSSEFVTTRIFRVLVNGIEVDAASDGTNFNVPLSPTTLNQSYTFYSVVLNEGDTLRVYWRDTIVT